MKTIHFVLIVVVLYALAVTAILASGFAKGKPVYVTISNSNERGRADYAGATALAAVSKEKLLRRSPYQVTATRLESKWVVTFVFENPPIIGGDVTAVVSDDGKVVISQGL